MNLNLPKSLDKFSHDDIVRILIELNPRFFRPDRGSWQQGIPDLEDPTRQIVEVALTKLRDAWGQCLYYYRSGASHVYLVLSPRLFLDYKNKESGFIRANPIPNVEVCALPELVIKSFLVHKKPKAKVKKKVVHVPELGFIMTEEDRQKALKRIKPREEIKKPVHIEQPIAITGVEPIIEEIEPNGDVDLEEYWKTWQPKPLEQVFTQKHCIDCKKFKVEGNIGYCPKYKWEIALDLAERDAVCEEL